MWCREDETQLKNCIKQLSKYLNRYYDKPVMLFLDEYDVPLQNAYVEGYYDEAVKFFKTFYGTTFKDNSYLEKTIITGVSRVDKDCVNKNDPFGVLDIAVYMPWSINIDWY